MRWRLLLASAAVMLLGGFGAEGSERARPTPIPDRIIVEFRDATVDASSLMLPGAWKTRQLFRATGRAPAVERLQRYHVLDLVDAGLDDATRRMQAIRLRKSLQQHPDVAAVFHDYPAHAASIAPSQHIAPGARPGGNPVPNDPLYQGKGIWEHPAAQEIGNQWPLEIIDAAGAWEIETGDPDQPVTIAVLDTGIDFSLRDLSSNMWINELEQGNDEDGNGFVGDVMGWDFTEDQPVGPTSDVFGHGTHVAGIAAAQGHNGTGMTGVIWDAEIMNVKVLADDGFGSLVKISEGIVYAADNGADVINLSLSTGSWLAAYTVPYMTEAIDHAADRGALIVAAAGNNSILNIGDHVAGVMPSSAVNAMAISSFTELDQMSSFSNSGPGISVAAPGGSSFVAEIPDAVHGVVSLQSTTLVNSLYDDFLLGGDYLRLGGTSGAAPHVGGVGALIRSRLPESRAGVARFAIEDGSVDVGDPGPDKQSGHGRLDARQALVTADVLLTPSHPELQVNRIELPLEEEALTNFDAHVEVQNLGNEAANSVPVRLYVGQQLLGQLFVDLAPGDRQGLVFPIAVGSTGINELEATINDDLVLPEYREANNTLASTMSIANTLLTPRAVADEPKFRDHVSACPQHVLWAEREVDEPDRFEVYAFTWEPGEDISDPAAGTGPTAISDNGENNVFPACSTDTIAWVKKTDTGDSIVTRALDDATLYEIPLDGKTAWEIDLEDGNLVWREHDGFDASVRWVTLGPDGVYVEADDGAPVTILTGVTFNVTAPKLQGSQVIWDVFDGAAGGFVIRRAPLASPETYETLHDSTPLNSHKPNVSGDNVVWMTNESSNGYFNEYTIYLKQGDDPPITLDTGFWTNFGDSYRCRVPQIEGSRISWIRFLNKNSFPWGSRVMTYDLGPDGVHGTLDDPGLSQKSYLTDFMSRLGMIEDHTAAILLSDDFLTSDVLTLSAP